MTYTVEPGRQIYHDGKPFISIDRIGETHPIDADAMAHKVCAWLNNTLTPLERMACEVALVTPLKQSQYSVEARVPWELVHRIREEGKGRGIDWTKARENLKRIVSERKKS